MSQYLRRVAVVWVLLLAASSEARETWVEIRSPNFVVVSNASEERARVVAARMEHFRRALSLLLPNQPLHSEVPTQVYAFRDFDSFESFLPRTEDGVTPAAGYFRKSPYKNVIAVDLSAGPAAYERVVFHELVHLVLSLSVQHYPLWFEEGLAEFYSSARMSAQDASLGLEEERHRRVLAQYPLLPMDELVTADEDWPLSADPRDSAVFYAQSWALVHYLVAGSGKEGHHDLARYLARLERGEERLEAFRIAFGRTPDAMGDELDVYVEKGHFPHYEFDLPPPDRERDFFSKTLSMSEVQLRWGELFLFTDRALEARMCLEEACRLDPASGAAWETLGILSLLDGAEDDALAYFERAVAQDDVSAVGLYHHARVLLRDYSGHWIKSLPDDVASEAERSLRRSLQMKPTRVDTAELLAFVYLVRGVRLEEATALVENALSMSPRDPSLLYLYSQLLARRGDYEQARDALALIQRDAVDAELVEAADALLARLDAAERAP